MNQAAAGIKNGQTDIPIMSYAASTGLLLRLQEAAFAPPSETGDPIRWIITIKKNPQEALSALMRALTS